MVIVYLRFYSADSCRKSHSTAGLLYAGSVAWGISVLSSIEKYKFVGIQNDKAEISQSEQLRVVGELFLIGSHF